MQLYRDIVKSTRGEAAIKMTQSRNNNSGDRNLDVGARLIEHEEIKALLFCEAHAGRDLLACVELTEFGTEVRADAPVMVRR